jgi:hypothetical protein
MACGMLIGAAIAACGGRLDGDDPNGTIDPSGGSGGAATGGSGGQGAGSTGGSGGRGGKGGSPGGPTDAAAGSGGTGGNGAGGTSGGAGGGSSGAAGTIGGTGGTGGTPTTAVCASASHCAAGQDCCLSNGQCFDAANRDACPRPVPDTTPEGRKRCAIVSDCGADGFCYADLCLGAGVCLIRPKECPDSPGPLCGCDGKEYSNAASACQAGVRLTQASVPARCGQVPPRDGSVGGGRVVCGSRAQCAAGEDCCLITGRCYDPAFPTLCSFPPAGTYSPCVDDSECSPPSTACWSSNCDGPGYCKALVFGQCSSVLEPVCGCEGKSYTNEECAWQKMVRIRHTGMCTAP